MAVDKPLHLFSDTRALRIAYYTDQTKYVDFVATSVAGLTISPGTADGADTGQFLVTSGGTASGDRGAYLALAGNEHANTGNALIQTGTAGHFRVLNGAGVELRFGSGSVLGVGTTVTTSAATGDVVLRNDAKLRSVNAAGTDTVVLVTLSAANKTTLNMNSLELVISGAATRTTIGANGAASALTANPVGYLDVNISGTNMQIPYYTRGA